MAKALGAHTGPNKRKAAASSGDPSCGARYEQAAGSQVAVPSLATMAGTAAPLAPAWRCAAPPGLECQQRSSGRWKWQGKTLPRVVQPPPLAALRLTHKDVHIIMVNIFRIKCKNIPCGSPWRALKRKICVFTGLQRAHDKIIQTRTTWLGTGQSKGECNFKGECLCKGECKFRGLGRERILLTCVPGGVRR
ncbi:MAG: hypothetical protein FRX49_11251 [Trebouxia sp. A1-2]|nr:MAG: hypothetical protein FRX49_11991 [Trebouxia sp. A1-2]KAA6418763.1 MAG: hypothetical protein FRX49_11251 [Trebouxia sp. A1-2]